MEPDEPAGRTLEAVEKAFDVVETLWEMEGAGVTAVAEALGLPKSTVHAHLRTLESNGYVVNDGGEYRLGLRFLTFGQFVRRAEPLFHAARQPVDDLAKRTGERVLCMTEQNGLGMVLYVGEGSRSLFGEVTVGTSIYHHCSAGGKAMMAHYPRERVDAIVDRWGLPAFTDETITDRETLLDELATVREEGIAFNREEYLRGVLAVGHGDQHQVGAGGQAMEALQHPGQQPRLDVLVVARRGIAPDPALNHHLGAGLGLRLEQHRVHVGDRRDAAGARLQRLGPADLAAVGGDRGVVRHVLRLERPHGQPAPGKGAAQPGDQQ